MKLFSLSLVLFLSLIINVMAGPKVALITGSETSENFQVLNKYLKKKKYRVTVFDLSKLESFPEEGVTKFEKSLVIRLVEKKIKSSYITALESDFWQTFLSSRGSMILFADTLGEANIYDSLFPDYVGFQNKKISINNGELSGVDKDLISDKMKNDISFEGETDEILPYSNAGIDSIITHSSGKVLGIKKRSCSYKISYFSFLPTWFKQEKARNSFLEKTLDWNLGFALGVDMDAPDFPVLKMDGTESKLSTELKKQENVVVLEFMATWCSSCATQLPRMVNLYNKYKNKGVSFYNINYKENIDLVSKYLKKHPELKWPIVITENGLGMKRFGVKSLPGIFILDRRRRVKFIHKGITSEKKLESEINEVLKLNNFDTLHNKLERLHSLTK
ncbi:MAG: hypothetical protein COB02_07255 [Candidatus Cloacimonadota bacterium]|nr:MAG: hypothetical protein COB02_07255 [Candidatus Cloacimonadota bacterium]